MRSAHLYVHVHVCFVLGICKNCSIISISVRYWWTVDHPILIQCNLDYPDLVYPDPRLSGLAGDQNIHYHACAEGVASDLLWVWSQIEWWATDSADWPWATCDMSWSPHISAVCAKARRILGLIYRRFYGSTDRDTIKQLHISLVRPHLEYGSQVWDPHLAKDKMSLENVQVCLSDSFCLLGCWLWGFTETVWTSAPAGT